MTQGEIIEMARQAFACTHCPLPVPEDRIEAFAKLVAAAEREACAKECEHIALRMGSEWMAQHCAEAIRAKGNQC